MINEIACRGVVATMLGYSVFLAHAFGGSVPRVSHLIVGAMVLAFLNVDSYELAGPKLASFLLGFQVLGHFSMPVSNADLRMQYSHIFAAVITYQLLKRFQLVCETFVKWVFPRFSKISFNYNFSEIVVFLKESNLLKYDFIFLFNLRAPPPAGSLM
ncbi:MAG: hypothetical protein ACKOCL_05920 [Candidatus Nanopelagicaceae bacterium]